MIQMLDEKSGEDVFACKCIRETMFQASLPEILIPDKIFLIFEAFVDNFDSLRQQIGQDQEKESRRQSRDLYRQNRVTKFVLNIIGSIKPQLETIHEHLLADLQKSKDPDTFIPQQEETLLTKDNSNWIILTTSSMPEQLILRKMNYSN